jgi:hypothetical protein
MNREQTPDIIARISEHTPEWELSVDVFTSTYKDHSKKFYLKYLKHSF